MTWARSDSTFSVKNPGDIANLLKDYFYSVAKPQCTSSNCVANLQPPTCCDFKNNTLRTISVISLSPSEVHDVPLSLDPNKAIGPDKIPAKLLKVCAPQIFLSLCALFNKWLQLGKMYYIPISLLPLVSKVLERCVYNRVIVRIPPQLQKMHFGFLKGKSTTAQLLQVLYNRDEKLDKRVKVDAIYLDVAKAFDRVKHELLLKMIQRFGICGNILS